MIKRLIAAILLMLTISWQAQSARSGICGFEGKETTSSSSVQSTVKRTGTYAFQSNPNSSDIFFSTAAGGTKRSLFRSVRFYFRVDALGSTSSPMYANKTFSTDACKDTIKLNSSGTISTCSSFSSGICNDLENSSNAFTADATWHRIDFDVGWSAGNGRRVFVDGDQWTSNTNTASTAGDSAAIGLGLTCSSSGGGNSGQNVYFDDVLWDDSTAVIGAGQSLLILPSADPGALNSWTGGAGGTTNIFNAVIVIPPNGKAVASEDNTTQIKNAASGGNLDYKPTTPSYRTAGVGASDTINAVMAITNDCEEITTGTKSGGVWIDTNPAQTAGGNSFDFGDDQGTGCSAWSSFWSYHWGPVSTSGVTIGNAATVAIRKTTATTRVTDADFLGIYVDYTPAVAGAVKRLPVLGIGAWLLTQITDIYNSMFESSVAFAAQGGPKPHPKDMVDADFLGIYVDYTPSGAALVSPHFIPTPTRN